MGKIAVRRPSALKKKGRLSRLPASELPPEDSVLPQPQPHQAQPLPEDRPLPQQQPCCATAQHYQVLYEDALDRLYTAMTWGLFWWKYELPLELRDSIYDLLSSLEDEELYLVLRKMNHLSTQPHKRYPRRCTLHGSQRSGGSVAVEGQGCS